MVSPFVCDTCTLTNGFHESTNANQCVVSPVDPLSVMNLPHEDITHIMLEEPPLELQTPEIPAATVDSLRKSNRTSKPPIWTKDYVISAKPSLYSITNYVLYDHLSTNYQDFVQAFSSMVEPQSFKEASQGERWTLAM